MPAPALSAHTRSAALLIALIVLVLPGGSLVLGVLWLYRHYRGWRTISASSALTPSPARSTTSGLTSSSARLPSR